MWQGQRASTGNMLDQQCDTFLLEVMTYLKSRFRNLQEKPYSLFRMFNPRKPDDVKLDCVILEGSLVDLMRVHSCEVSTKGHSSGPTISHWILDVKTKGHTL